MADSLRETLAAALGGSAESAPDGQVAPVAAEPSHVDAGHENAPASSGSARDALTGTPLATTESEAKAAKIAGQPRSEDGKFAPKTQAAEGEGAPAAQPKPDEPKPNSEPAQAAGTKEAPSEEPIRVPASLPAALKAEFKELPEKWREAFLKREEDVNTAKAQWDAKAAQFNRLEEILAPRREKFQLQGLDDARAIQTLFAAQDLLDRSPLEGLAYLARSYGVDLRQIGGQQSAAGQQAPQAGAPQLDPALQPLMQKVQTLEQQLQAQTEAARQAELQKGISEVEAFRSDPANMYFDDVKGHVVALLESGAAGTLQDAYQQAIWAHPEIRPLLLKAQQEEAQKVAQRTAAEAQAQADATARAKAAAAQQAGGSVTGAPGAAVAPPAQGSKGSIRQDLLAAMGEHAPQV